MSQDLNFRIALKNRFNKTSYKMTNDAPEMHRYFKKIENFVVHAHANLIITITKVRIHLSRPLIYYKKPISRRPKMQVCLKFINGLYKIL